jgi:hypothetical protein
MQPDLKTIHKDPSNTIITAYKKGHQMVNSKNDFFNSYLLQTISIYFNQTILAQR